MRFVYLSIFILLTTLLSACSEKVQYGDAQAEETTTIDFGSTDLQSIAEKMVDELLEFKPVLDSIGETRPVVFIDRIVNKTSEHVDTESITDTIQNRLLRSGKFRFVDMTAVEAVTAQFQYQTQSGLVDPAKAVAIGKHTGARLMLYGNLSSIVKRKSDNKDVYYKFTLKLLDLESGFVEWSGEKEIRKTAEKTLFGL